jgi:hypothetical protein
LNNRALLLINSPLTVGAGRGTLAERLERLFPGNSVFLDLLVLALVLLEGLLLVLRDQVVDVGSALASRDVPWRSGVEDPVNVTLARVHLILLPFEHVVSADISSPKSSSICLPFLSSSRAGWCKRTPGTSSQRDEQPGWPR